MINNEHTYSFIYDLQWAHIRPTMIYNEHTYNLWFKMSTFKTYMIYNEHTYNIWFTMSTFKSMNYNEHT